MLRCLTKYHRPSSSHSSSVCLPIIIIVFLLRVRPSPWDSSPEPSSIWPRAPSRLPLQFLPHTMMPFSPLPSPPIFKQSTTLLTFPPPFPLFPFHFFQLWANKMGNKMSLFGIGHNLRWNCACWMVCIALIKWPEGITLTQFSTMSPRNEEWGKREEGKCIYECINVFLDFVQHNPLLFSIRFYHFLFCCQSVSF